jgi:hypothetical protein
MAIRPAARRTATRGRVSAWAWASVTPNGALNIRGGYIAVDLCFTDTFQYTKLYAMRDSVERILANLGEVMWDEPDADKKNRHLWVRRDVDFSGDMTEAYRWMTDGLLAMRNVYELLG